ncbi:MAG TPA: phosphate ABC transporter permease subunit PstC [Methanocella sp.]|nr:phosphate ABC transporter permease subunit PstC [Methanocella sp.]
MKIWEKLVEISLFICAISSVMIIALIFLFIIYNGFPIIISKGLISFVFGGTWKPDSGVYGVFPLLVGSFVITILSLVISVPLSLGCAMLISEIAPEWIRNLLRPAIDTLAGIPSIIYGLFGLVILVPFIMNNLGGPGQSVLACGIVLAVMVLPTIVSISEDSMKSVPRELREGSLALGATRWQMITGIVVPSALSGIVASIVLAMGRSIGETMAVIMVCGGVAKIPSSLLSPVYPMTAIIASEWGYASGDHQVALFAVGIVLLFIIMILNIVILFSRRYNLKGHKV